MEAGATLAEDIAAAKEEGKALPDMHVKVNPILAEYDLVSVYWNASGTNAQEGMGFPATGRRIVVPGMTLFRCKARKISEEWSVSTCCQPCNRRVYALRGSDTRAPMLPVSRGSDRGGFYRA